MQVKIEAIIFDLFGTLIRYRVQHHPYRQLLKWAREHGRIPQPSDARVIMTHDEGIELLTDKLRVNAPAGLLNKLTDDIETELQSLTLFDDVEPTLEALHNSNIRLAICSNLAKPYGAVIPRLLSNFSFTHVLSYECGFIKPEPEIYKLAAAGLNVSPKECLFVGDTYLADYHGPCEAGMSALHLVRDKEPFGDSIAALTDLIHGYRDK